METCQWQSKIEAMPATSAHGPEGLKIGRLWKKTIKQRLEGFAEKRKEKRKPDTGCVFLGERACVISTDFSTSVQTQLYKNTSKCSSWACSCLSSATEGAWSSILNHGQVTFQGTPTCSYRSTAFCQGFNSTLGQSYRNPMELFYLTNTNWKLHEEFIHP